MTVTLEVLYMKSIEFELDDDLTDQQKGEECARLFQMLDGDGEEPEFYGASAVASDEPTSEIWSID